MAAHGITLVVCIGGAFVAPGFPLPLAGGDTAAAASTILLMLLPFGRKEHRDNPVTCHHRANVKQK
jgi:hypothetical protein